MVLIVHAIPQSILQFRFWPFLLEWIEDSKSLPLSHSMVICQKHFIGVSGI